MSKLGIACLPLVSIVPKPKSNQWTKTKCPVCDCDCWETDTYKWAKQAGIIKRAACTECALKATQQEGKVHDGSFSNCDVCTNITCEDGWCSWDD